jgi:hypothetical protein
MRPPFFPRLFALIVPLFAILAPAASAADPAPAPTAARADDIPALIKQLGDDSPKVRDAASQQLRQLGPAALPALTEAQKSDDPEVANRAQTISRQIADDRNPAPRRTSEASIDPFGLPGGGIGRVRAVGPGGGAVGATKSVRISRGPDGVFTRVTTVNEVGQRVTIREDAQGIAVTTTKSVDGKDVEETVKAKDKDALQKEHPDAFAVYERHTKQTARVRGGFNGGVEIGGGGLNAAEQAQVEAALRKARELVDQQLQQNAAGGAVDPKAQAELEKALEEARAMALEHRKLAEEQIRVARQQMLDARRQIEEAQRQRLEEIQRQREQQLKENRRVD